MIHGSASSSARDSDVLLPFSLDMSDIPLNVPPSRIQKLISSVMKTNLSMPEQIFLLLVVVSGVWLFFRERCFPAKQANHTIFHVSEEHEQPAKGDGGKLRSLVEQMRTADKNCVIVFGSQTGTAEGYASRLAQEGKSRFGLRTMTANPEEFHWKDLEGFSKHHIMILVLATYGEGEPTDNAVEFHEIITQSNESTDLSNISHAAFGLGNSTYEKYNSVIKTVNSSLIERGAHPLCAIGEGDDGTGTTEDDFLSWKETMWGAAAKHLGLQAKRTVYEPMFQIIPRTDITPTSDVVYCGEPTVSHLGNTPTGPYGSGNPFIAPVVGSKELFSMADRNCIHMELSLTGSNLTYQTGDHVAVWPMNSNLEVSRFLGVHGWLNKRSHVVQITGVDPATKVHLPSPTTYEAAVKYYLDIGSSVSRQLVSTLAQFAPDEKCQVEMTRLGTDKVYFAEKVTKPLLNIAQLLEVVGEGKLWDQVPFSLYVESLLRLQPRYYSISSSSLIQPEQVSITAVVESTSLIGRVDPWKGVATNYLLAMKREHCCEKSPDEYETLGPRNKYSGSRIAVHIRSSKFRLPSDPSVPVVMVGPGTGVAPFRAFLQERVAQKQAGKEVGRMLLFYGCRTRTEDYIYADDWEVSSCPWKYDKLAKIYPALQIRPRRSIRTRGGIFSWAVKEDICSGPA